MSASAATPTRALRHIRRSLHVLGDHSHAVTEYLEKATLDGEFVERGPSPHAQAAFAEEGHERRVTGENADLAVVGGRRDGVGIAVEHGRLGRDDADPHHALASFLDFSTASSIVPTM